MKTPAFILVVDDDTNVAAILAHLLRSAGYRSETAREPLGAAGVARKDRPALLLMDLMMPGLDGATATQMFKTEPALQSIPIVMMSALPPQDARRRAFECGAAAFLPKPFDREGLLSTVARVLGEAPAARVEEEPAVLLIDDDPVIVKLLTASFKGAGFVVWEAFTAADGLKLARAVRPSLIVSDVGLPDLDGTELCIQLKSAPDTARIPVVFISGNADEETHDVARFTGGAVFMDKPLDVPALVRTARDLIRTPNARPTAREGRP